MAAAIDGVRFDLGYAARSLTRARGFAGAAVLIFALGIGVSVVAFTAVDRALFRELPYGRPADIVVMREVADDSGRAFGTVPAAIVLASRRHHRGFLDVSVSGFTAAFSPTDALDGAQPVRLTAATYNTLSLFGVDVLRGRDFSVEDAAAKRRVALVSFETWQRRFARAEDIVGRRLYDARESAPVEIVGVLPADFIAPSSFLNPLSDGLVLDSEAFAIAAPAARSFPAYVRLSPATSLEAAQAELNVLVDTIRRHGAEAEHASATSIQLVPLESVLFARHADHLWLLVGAASLLLAVACANLGGLMLVRNRSREQQAATQIALGAPGWRLIRVGIFESVLLALAGAVVALLIISWGDSAVRAVVPPVFSRYTAGLGEPRVFGFSLLTAFACTVLAGAYPSWRLARVSVLPLLPRGRSSRAFPLAGGRPLLVVETALSIILVAGAAMTIRSFAALSRTELGFRPDNLYTVVVGWPADVDAGRRYQQALLALQALLPAPGVEAVAAVDANPISGSVGMAPIGPGFDGTSRWRMTSGFLDAMGIRLLAGRQPSSAEVAADAPVGVLSESALHRVWPGLRAADAIGKLLRVPGEPAREIIGVVSDVRSSHAAPAIPSLYLPLSARSFRRAEFIVRMAPGAAPASAEIRRRIRQATVSGASVTIDAVSHRLRAGLTDQRFRASLFSVLGVTALVLAAAGLYAIGAYEVSRREREIGIRLAIGGSRGTVHWLIVRQTLAPVMTGVGAGLCGAYWAASFVQAFLHEVDARDPATLVVVVIVLLTSAALAAWLPARRAARLDPAAVLRLP